MFKLKNIVLGSVAALGLSLGLMGCAPGRPDVVPSSAEMWDAGNQMMHYQAPADGMVYVYDETAQRLIWSGKVMKGQSVDVDTQKGVVMAAGMVVVNKLAGPADQKNIYFDRAPEQSRPAWNNSNPNPNGNGVTVTPNVTVQPNDGTTPGNGVTVQPGVTVTPSPAPTPAPNP